MPVDLATSIVTIAPAHPWIQTSTRPVIFHPSQNNEIMSIGLATIIAPPAPKDLNFEEADKFSSIQQDEIIPVGLVWKVVTY